jgi:hypothetical protein
MAGVIGMRSSSKGSTRSSSEMSIETRTFSDRTTTDYARNSLSRRAHLCWRRHPPSFCAFHTTPKRRCSTCPL